MFVEREKEKGKPISHCSETALSYTIIAILTSLFDEVQ